MTSLEKLQKTLDELKSKYGDEPVVMRITIDADDDDNDEDDACPICDKPNSGGVPCSKDCLKADML